MLHADFNDGEAYQKASWLYHEKLSDFGTAFALNQQWLERHPEDLFAQGDFAERHFTTGRFVEAKERLAALLANPELDPRIRIALQALEIATLLALNDPRSVPQRLERLRAAVQSRPQDFQVAWGFAGSKRFIATDPRLAPHRAWLQTLFTALEGENRDAILAALEGVREKLTQREGPRELARILPAKNIFPTKRGQHSTRLSIPGVVGAISRREWKFHKDTLKRILAAAHAAPSCGLIKS